MVNLLEKLDFTENELISAALQICEDRALKSDYITSPKATTEYLKLKLANYENEAFLAIWLDSRHGVIECQQLFTGTIDGASVYPRVVVKAGLTLNAAAVIFCHNHPSGSPEPSPADIRITERLKASLALIDIRVLDHIIVGGANHVSLAERGQI